jgi:hypothetical protein
MMRIFSAGHKLKHLFFLRSAVLSLCDRFADHLVGQQLLNPILLRYVRFYYANDPTHYSEQFHGAGTRSSLKLVHF